MLPSRSWGQSCSARKRTEVSYPCRAVRSCTVRIRQRTHSSDFSSFLAFSKSRSTTLPAASYFCSLASLSYSFQPSSNSPVQGITFNGFTGLGGALATSIAELPPPAGKSVEPPLGQPARISEKARKQTTTETLA